jgi:hypothetical protein
VTDDFEPDFDMTLPGDEGAPLPLCIGSEKLPREVLEPHLSSGYDHTLSYDPCILLRGHIGPACILLTTPAVGKEAWAMANALANQIEEGRTAFATIPNPTAFVDAAKGMREALAQIKVLAEPGTIFRHDAEQALAAYRQATGEA